MVYNKITEREESPQAGQAAGDGGYTMIEEKSCFLFVCRNTLERMLSGQHHGRETRQGVMWAIKFVKSLDHEVMTERELSHAIRCTTFRGQQEPRFC